MWQSGAAEIGWSEPPATPGHNTARDSEIERLGLMEAQGIEPWSE
jgi:hypothetical protein